MQIRAFIFVSLALALSALAAPIPSPDSVRQIVNARCFFAAG
jgi:hypothetical protein